MAHFGEPYFGQSLSTCVNLILQKLLRQKRRAASSEEKVQAYRKQDGKCENCACELDDACELDHDVPVKTPWPNSLSPGELCANRAMHY